MFLDDLPEIVFAGLDDGEFALGIFLRIARVRGVDHDVRAEFAADEPGGALDGSVGPSTSRILRTAFTPS